MKIAIIIIIIDNFCIALKIAIIIIIIDNFCIALFSGVSKLTAL